ncbi:MAG: methyltransferase domain-containing protein [Rhizobiales bacterium]|nr:methyltransferase domain-containing protein [Hyphomicrobiales bacterium]
MILDRRLEILKFITKPQRGIEIAPYFNPLVPKRSGYDSLIVDVVDAEVLRAGARKDPLIPDSTIQLIEHVDIVGSASDLADLVAADHPLGTFDYVVSSHNFEHLPDPIRFLRGCEAVLKPGGFVSMAVPDKRACFDYFRPVTSLAEWLAAFRERRQRPTHASWFESRSLNALFRRGTEMQPGFSLADDPSGLVPDEVLDGAYATWNEREESGDAEYHDTHCSVLTPASLRLMLTDLQFLRILNLEIVEISGVNWHEFYVHLRKPADPLPLMDRSDFYARRPGLLRCTIEEQAEGSSEMKRLRAIAAGFSSHPEPVVTVADLDPRVSSSRSAAFRHWLRLVVAKSQRRPPTSA